MAKQGQHKHDAHDHRLMPATGHNNPRKTTPSTTGTYKKRSKRHAGPPGERKQPSKRAQPRAFKWHPDTREFVTHEADSQARAEDRKLRSGSDSNTEPGTRGY